MENRMKALVRYAGLLAAMLFAAALIGFGAALPGYSHAQYPVALLGATGFPHALAFNLCAFVLPGLLAGVVAMALRATLPADAGWTLRVGAQLVLVSALAFIALGALPLDPADLENQASQLHGTAWMLWSVAFVPGALLLGAALRAYPAWSRLSWLSLVAAGGVLLAGFVLTGLMPAGIAQRIAFAIWMAWLALAGWQAARAAVAVDRR